jgi:hypothetical protein
MAGLGLEFGSAWYETFNESRGATEKRLGRDRCIPAYMQLRRGNCRGDRSRQGRPVQADHAGRSGICSYENDKFLISVYTGNEELTEFQKDSNEAKKRNDTWGKTIKVSNVSVPYYQSIGEGRLIAWKNKTRFTVGVQDVTFSMSDEALEAAREKLINIGLSRIK